MLNLSFPTREQIKEYKERYTGKKVHVIIADIFSPFEGEGIVDLVDDAGQVHGNWVDENGDTSSLAAIPGVDSIIILEN